MTPELVGALRDFARKHGWRFCKDKKRWPDYRTIDAYRFDKTYTEHHKYSTTGPWPGGMKRSKARKAVATVKVQWNKKIPTVLLLTYPHLKMRINGNTYNGASCLVDPDRIDLTDPSSLDTLLAVLDRADNQYREFMDKSIKRLNGLA